MTAMTNRSQSASLFAPLFSSAAMCGAVDDLVRLQRMLDVESALARAEADVGVIPKSAAGPIAAACRALAAKIGKHSAHQLLEEASRKAIAEKCRASVGARDRAAVRPLVIPRSIADFHYRMLARAKTR
jgi:3-carboxy-cis,cis-muconate cycloisomerase